MGPEALAQVLRPLSGLFPAAEYPDLLVGLEGPDDAAVYRLDDTRALVVTTDFFPPVVDDPYSFGAIAAANAMSDVFAMGGTVLLALNLLGAPADLPPEVVSEILRGGGETVKAGGGVVAGGHSIIDAEPKYGLAVVGMVDPRAILRKSGARPGDALVLTKALGTGLVTTAIKRGRAVAEDVAAAVASMSALNRAAGACASRLALGAATDITGFGLAGHALEMAEQSGVDLVLDLHALPLLPGAWSYALAGMVPGGGERNREAFGPRVDGLDDIDANWSRILFDPQTSGGLLMAVAPPLLPELLAALDAEGVLAAVIGEARAGSGRLVVRHSPEGMG